ncbi:prolipoprotein diacylglyceryl transferase [Psittacicella hinzii]|uniref:Phosphatidylglycerol--prolipoprotein diacylglyceryl transferase n=1 Tax=Psittacicella hinzii TaxID=2028575 RepID=A0A3A1YQ27_9GAMM|nr:prolipoprotein diacylglyceryl transferase [Psittacicella hinzii]RIY40302.1 prolipoprotein diacylglyceryl transferase [Psittacicella hinzii]
MKILISILLIFAALFSTASYAAIPFPQINPTAFTVFGFNVQWYGICYLIGLGGALLFNYLLLKRDHRTSKTYNAHISAGRFTDIAVNCFLGAIIGGRLGYVLFYDLQAYLADPIQIFMIHKGGMSFHGGFLGVLATLWLQTRKTKDFWTVADLGATVIPFALCVGRIGNFINGELWGRPTDVPWAMEFPSGGYIPRHPSQLYEAALEGLVLFIILVSVRWKQIPRPGLLSGLFVMGYGISRFIIEFFRNPDAQLGYVLGPFTQGQVLSTPMILFGLWLVLSSKHRKVNPVTPQFEN